MKKQQEDIFKRITTPRGFTWFNFKDLYDNKCSLSESSNAETDCVWLGITKPEIIIQYKDAVASGKWLVGHGYSSDAIQMMLEDDNIGFALPKEGFTIAFDEMVIPADSQQPDLAHKFINFVYRPEIAKANIEGVCAPMPVKGALELLEPKLRRLVEVDANTFRRGEVLQNIEDKPAVRDMYLKAWERIKAGK